MSARPGEPTDRPLKRSVALALADPTGGGRVLAVLRPPDDEDLPGAWGLPAASLLPGESWEEAVGRAAREKLGVEVRAAAVLAEGRTERRDYSLEMRLYRVDVVRGEPHVGRELTGRTRYVDWRWAEPEALAPAADRGSLCARLFLESAG